MSLVPWLDMDRELSPEHMGSMQAHLLKFTGGRSVPRVLSGGEFVDGDDDVAALHGCVSLPLDLPPGWTALSGLQSDFIGRRDGPGRVCQGV